MPKIGNQTQKIPPKTSVRDSNVRSAAGNFLDPIEYRISPLQTKVPCKAEREEFLNVVKKLSSLKIKIANEIIAQNNPAKAIVVKVGIFLFHLKVIEPIEKPKADISPTTKPNSGPSLLLL